MHYDDWRAAVFKRDNFTCVICGERGGKLTADHIKPWCLYPALRLDIDNGRTLCRPCHSKQDTTGHRMSNALYKEKKKRGAVQYRLI
jgi:5-methylcytosine-specific restriction endonuclease McrA